MTAPDLAASRLADYARDGFLVLDGFLSPADCDALQARAAELAAGFDPGPGRTIFSARDQGHAGDRYFQQSGGAIRFFFEEDATDQPVPLALNKIGHALHDLDPVFDRISRQPRVARLAEALGFVQPLLLQSMYLFKQPQIGAEVGWHQDATYLYTRPVTVTGLWIALDDADRDNGCLMALPGGHRGALRQRFRRVGDRLVSETLDEAPWPDTPAGGARGAARQPGRAARAAAACQCAQPVGPAASCLCLAPDRRACGVSGRQLAAKARPAAARIFVIPKAELHCHLEGSIPPALARELAARNGLGVPPGLIGDHGHYVWKDFLSFLATYDLVCTTLRTARDFGDVIYSYLASVARQGAIYVEMFCSPERPAALGITYNAWLEALEGGIDRARRDFGIEGRIIIICIRHLGPERALAMAQAMVAEPHHYVVGFGMGGDEARFSARRFRAGLPAGPRQGLRLHRPCRRGSGPGKRVGGDQRPAGDPHRPRRALGRRSRSDGRAGAPRHRPRGLSRQQHCTGPVSGPPGPSAAPVDRGGRPRHAQFRRPAVLPHHARRGVRQGGSRRGRLEGYRADGDRGVVRRFEATKQRLLREIGP